MVTLIVSLQPYCPCTAGGSYQSSAVWSDKLWLLGQSDYCGVRVFEVCGDGRRLVQSFTSSVTMTRVLTANTHTHTHTHTHTASLSCMTRYHCRVIKQVYDPDTWRLILIVCCWLRLMSWWLLQLGKVKHATWLFTVCVTNWTERWQLLKHWSDVDGDTIIDTW